MAAHNDIKGGLIRYDLLNSTLEKGCLGKFFHSLFQHGPRGINTKVVKLLIP